ncbi:MAG TPA: hypothetical protein VIL16_12530 [Trebonia sp.]
MSSKGYKHSEEARARIAEASRTRERKPWTDEQRAKIRETTQAAMQRPEVKARLSAAATAQEHQACPEGCTCGRHQGFWAGKKRPELAGRQPNLRHGHASTDPATGEVRRSPTYRSWNAMKARCRRAQGYVDRGIEVCPRWLTFENFLADMGERLPDTTIDRIDNDGGYWCGHCDWCRANNRPPNCRWASRSVQQQNRRPMPDQPNQYSTGKVVPRVNDCGHPDRPHRAKGMCGACYQQDRKSRA